MKAARGHAGFIGRIYLDMTLVPDGEMPTGDKKAAVKAWETWPGGNAVGAALICRHLGVKSTVLCNVAGDDWTPMVLSKMAEFDVTVVGRRVSDTARSVVIPRDGYRTIFQFPPHDEYLETFPAPLPPQFEGIRLLHMDGHMIDAAIAYAQYCRENSIVTMLDGGKMRNRLDELLDWIDVAIVSVEFCHDVLGPDRDPADILPYLKDFGCKVGAVTMGEYGIRWYAEDYERGAPQFMPSHLIPAQLVLNTNGAGDFFHGACAASYLLNGGKTWAGHFAFANAASAYAIQRLPLKDRLPSVTDITKMLKRPRWKEAA